MKAKRFFSVLLAIMMLVSCFAISASAATKPETGSLTIHLFKGTNAIDQDDRETGAEQDSFTGDPIDGVVFTITRVADTETSTSSPAALTGANAFTADLTATSNGVTSKTGLKAGRYFVSVKSKPANVGTIASFLVDVPMTNPDGNGYITDVHVYPKTTETPIEDPSISKQVGAVPEEGEISYGSSANLSKDQYASWKITVNVPAGIEYYKKFVVTDKVDSRLSDPEDVTVTGVAATAYTKTVSGKLIKIDFTDNVAALKDVETITITYKTKITDNLAGVKIANHTDLTYNNDPGTVYDPTKDEVVNNHPSDNDPDAPSDPDNTNPYNPEDPYGPANPEKDPFVWTGSLSVMKTDGTNAVVAPAGTAAADKAKYSATFELYDNEACTGTAITTFTTDPDTGKSATYSGLKDGTYYLKETKAPKGYELNSTPVAVTIGAGASKAVKADFAFADIPSTKLPLTGGMGVGMFAVLGLALAAFGGVYLFKTRKVGAC